MLANNFGRKCMIAGVRYSNLLQCQSSITSSCQFHLAKLSSTVTSSASTLNNDLIKIDQSINGVYRIIMCDTKTRNSLSMKMMTELIKAIKKAETNDLLARIITIEAAGPVFSGTGYKNCHNLNAAEQIYDMEYFQFQLSGSNYEKQKEIFAKSTELMLSIRNSMLPVIGVVKGLAAAAGCQLVAGCDFTIAAENAKFSTPGANFGLFCSTPGIPLGRVINRSKAAYMVLTGKELSSKEALESGLVVKVVPDDQLDSFMKEIYASIINKSNPVIKFGKRFFNHQLTLSYEEALKQGEEAMLENLKMTDCQEGLNSFKEKRKPVWTHKTE